MSYPDITLTPRALLQQMMASTSNEDVALLSEFCRRFLLSGVTISITGVISGLSVALSGDGNAITNLNATQLLTGTVPLGRLANLTDAEIAAAAAIAWTKISKTSSSLADLATRSAADLSSGTIPTARLGTGTASILSIPFGDQVFRRPGTAVSSVTSSATPTVNIDTTELYDLTALAEAAAFAAPTGTPVNGQKLIIRIKDNGTARALTWNAAFVAGGAALPSTTVLSKILTLGFIYNTANSLNKWQCVAASQEA